MTAKRTRKPRPVFLSAALRRTARQPTWRKRLRSTRAIFSFLLADASWWLRRGLWQVPTTLRLARSRVTLSIHHNIPSPAVDVYIPPSHYAYLNARLATVSCAAPAPPDLAAPSAPPHPVVVYVHGGAWGAGAASHYAQLASALATHASATVLVLSYRLYPAAKMDHQAADVTAALRYARRLFPQRPVAVLAHSSGAHLVALSLLRAVAAPDPETLPLADAVMLTAGPFHLMHHFLFEAGRGVADVSPMLPAACAEDDPTQFDARSPTCLAEAFSGALREVDGLQPPPDALEGELAAGNISLPEVNREKRMRASCASFPRTYVMTSSCDSTVPMYSSLRFAAALRRIGLDSKLLVYDFAEHIDFVTDWFAGVEPRDRSDVLDVGDEDRQRRLSIITLLKGRSFAALSEKSERKMGPTPYVRDVLRILKSLTLPTTSTSDEIV